MTQHKKAPEWRQPLFGRRDFIAVMTAFVGGTAATDLGTYHLHTAHQKLLESMFFTEKDRLALVGDIFFPKDTHLDVVPARNHPTLAALSPDEITYSNELQALHAIRSLFGPAREIVQRPYPSKSTNSLISVGSSISNILTRSILGPPKSPHFVLRTPQFSATLQYTIQELKGPLVTRLQDGSELTVSNRAVVDRRGRPVAVPESTNQVLTSDVLLVTRIPRSLGGSEIVIFCGLHGPGTRAIEHLLFHAPVSDLLYLRQMLEDQRESPYFQAVFRIDKLYEEENTTKPGTLQLVTTEAAKPRPIEIRLS